MYLYCTTKLKKSNALKRGTGFDGVSTSDGVTRQVKRQFGLTKYQCKNPVKIVKYIDMFKKVCYN